MIEIRTRIAQIEDLPVLLDIYNYEAENGYATFDIEPKTYEERKVWFDEHNVDNHPLSVALIEDEVVGYASLSPYRTKEAYAATVELSVYVHKDFRGRGVAMRLMQDILQMARADESIHTVVSVITAGNEASEKLHEKFGFSYSGTLHEVGIKWGKYLDIVNYELLV